MSVIRIKRFDDVLYLMAFACLIIFVIDALFQIDLFSFVFRNFHLVEIIFIYFVASFLVLSLISLFKEHLFFHCIPYNLHIAYVLLTFAFLIFSLTHMD